MYNSISIEYEYEYPSNIITIIIIMLIKTNQINLLILYLNIDMYINIVHTICSLISFIFYSSYKYSVGAQWVGEYGYSKVERKDRVCQTRTFL